MNNIVEAVFGTCNPYECATRILYRYDYGMILTFPDLELPMAYQAHFSNSDDEGQTITQIGDENGVLIPDELLTTGLPVYCWIYLHTGEDDGETVYKVTINVKDRPQPSDEVPTPVEQSEIDQAIAALQSAVAKTAQDVIDADASAQSASDSAEEAKGYSESAKGYDESAKGYSESASDSANEAKGYAEDAEESAQSVLGLTADATVDSNVGTPSVSVSVTTESDHKNMSFAFHNLKGVQGEPGDTGVGISSVVLNADYTLTITLTNGTSYTTTSIRGEVGATPNLTIGTVTTLPEGSQATATITGTDEDPVLNLGIPVGDTGDPGISPTITVTEITGGHEVSVTDAEGTESFNVMDGLDGQSGLITDYIAEEKTPYLFRPSANGLANVISEKDTLIGGTVAWNQLVQKGDFPDDSDWVANWLSVSYNDHKATLVRTVTGSASIYRGISIIANHKYLVGLTVTPSSTPNSRIRLYSSLASLYAVSMTLVANAKNRMVGIANPSWTDSESRIYFYAGVGADSGQIGDSYILENFVCIDLTQAFGSTIADYLYTLEQGTSGSGIAKLKEWGFCTKDYYPYNSGDLQSVQTSAHVMRDADDNVIGNYPLDSDLVLRGVLKLDAFNNLYYNGDQYRWDGSVTRKYGTVDLGTLSWAVEVASTGMFYSNVNAIKLKGMILNAQGWTCQQGSTAPSSWDDKSVGATNSQVYLLLRIKDSAYANMTASQFKTAMSGKYIVYELATETSETADPFAQYQIVSADGTEEYVDERTVPIPVGHDTYYQQSVDVPQLPTADGSYRLALSKTGNTATASWEYVAQAEMKAQTNITSGKYFSVGERLFVSTQAIAQGANIVVGTNCTETTLADALNQINS